MDPFNSQKHSIKVIVSEALMVLAVIAMVIVLALLVSGYWLNSNFEVERNGMLQISSSPAGADVEIDNEHASWLERTNSSKILKSGEHSIVLTKDGYDSWSKTINIAEGLLYRLHYPRLFLKDRKTDSVLKNTKYTSASVSSDHNAMLLMNDTTEWAYLNLDTDEPKLRNIDVSKYFTSINQSDDVTQFTGTIKQIDWDYDGSHALFKVTNGDATEWVLLDVNNIDKSVNLTKEFGTSFSRIEILDNNSNNLLAIRNNNLHKIDISGKLISAILVENVVDYDHFNNEIVFSASKPKDDAESETSESDESANSFADSLAETPTESPADEQSGDYYVGYMKLGDSKPTVLETIKSPAKVTISKFYDNKYITVIKDQDVFVHQKDAYEESIAEYKLSFVPDKVEVGHNGEFILFEKDHQIASLDMEAERILEWSIESSYGWLDNDMLYTVNEGDLIVYDFDGLNRRVIAHDVSDKLPVTIVGEKWLYYFTDSKLVREWLVEH